MAKIISAADAATAFRLIADYIEQQGGLTSTTSTSAADVEVLDEEEMRNLPIKELRAKAVELDLDEQKQKAGILAEMEAKGFFGDEDEDEDDEDETDDEGDEEEEDEDEADEDEDDEDEEDEEEGFDRDELEEMSLAELRKLAKQEGHKSTDYRGLDQDALVDLLMGEDEDDEDGDEEEEEEIDEDTLKSYDLNQLRAVAKELNLTIPARIKSSKPKIVDFILENAAEGDDEE